MKKLKSFVMAILIIACMACLSVGFVACGSSDDNGSNGGSQPTMTVGLNKLDATLILGSKTESGLTLIATVTQASGEEYAGEYIWKCEGTAVTILDNKETCVVQAAEVGTASVTVTVGNFSVTCNITVIENSVTKLTVDKNTMSLAVDGEDTVNVTATLADGTAYIDFEWELSGETVASVTKTGSVLTVTGLGEGSTTLTVSAGNLTAKCEITVGGGSETHEHTFPAPGSDDLVIEWKWNERDETSSTVEVVITCSGCNEEVGYTVEYTSDDDGKTLTASLTVGSNTYTSTYDVETGGSEEGGHAHSYTASWEWDNDYTCTVTLTCSDEDGECDEKTVTGTATVEEEEIPATCTEDGSVMYTASFEYDGETYVCDEAKTQTIPATGHMPVSVGAVEATCETAGSIEYWKCSVCGKIFSEETCENELTADDIVVPAGHKLEYIAAVSATCQSEGSIAYWKCSVCDRMFTDNTGSGTELFADGIVTEKTDHTPGSTYSYDNGYHYTTCTVCGTALGGDAHVFNENYVCETCGYANLLKDGTYGVVYSLVSGSTTEYEVTGFEGCVSAELLIIAPMYNGLPVVQIAQNAFQNETSIKEVVLQTNMATLGNSAFYRCYGLEKVTMTDVATIGNKVFQECTSLREIDFGQKLTSLGSNAFNGCSSLTRIELPATLTTIGQSCFKDCTALVTVSFSEGLQSISTYAFNGCCSLAILVIPRSVSYVGEGVFEDVNGPIYITNDKAYVDANWQQADASNEKDPWDDEYSGEVYYYSETAPTDDGYYWHYNDAGEIEIWKYDPDVGEEDEDIFTYIAVAGGYQVTGLKDGVTATELVISETYNDLPVVSIGEKAFNGDKSITDVVLGASVREIGANAFMNCTALEYVIFSEVLETIGPKAFSGCSALKELVIPSTVSFVGEKAFGDGVTAVIYIENDEAFVAENWQQRVRDPEDDDEWINAWNNDFSGDVYYYSDTEPELNADGTGYDGNYWHYVGGAVEIWVYTPVDEYLELELTSDGSGYQVKGIKEGSTVTEIIIPDTYNDLPVVSICEKAFNGNNTITEVVLGASVREIGANAFMNCTALESVVFSEVLETIGSKAFSGCSALRELVIPSTVSFVGEKAFGDGVTADIYIENNEAYVTENWQQRVRDSDGEWINAWSNDFNGTVYYYSEYEPELNSDQTAYDGNFWHYVDGEIVVWEYVYERIDFVMVLVNDGTQYEITGLKDGVTITELVIPDTYNGLPVVSIGSRAFQSNGSITSVVIGANVTKISDYAFYGCSGLASVVLSAGLTEIGAKAFSGCTELTSDIIIPSSVSYVGEKAFEQVSVNLYVEKTESQVSDTWQQVVRDEDNDIETDVWSKSFSGTVYYYSEYEPDLNADQTAYDGNFWHYDEDGVTPVIWEYTPADENLGTEGLAYSAVSGGYQLTGIGTATDTALVIPDTYNGEPVVSVYKNAFKNNSTITSVVFGSNVTEIGDSAFYGCSAVTTVVLPDGLEKIADKAFYDCTALADGLVVPSSVTYVGEKAFYGVPGNLYIENTEEYTKENWQQKDSKEDMEIWSNGHTTGNYYYSVDEPALNSEGTNYDGNFWHYDDLGGIVIWEYTPGESGPEPTDGLAYAAVTGGYRVTGKGTATDLTVLVIPDTYDGQPVVSIGGNAFDENDDITMVYFGANIVEVGKSAFADCTSLTTVVLSSSLTTIGSKAFKGCSVLKDVVIPASVSYVSEYAFQSVAGPLYIESSEEYVKANWQQYDDDDDMEAWSKSYTGTIYYYSEEDPGSGNFWHYDADGVTPVAWY